ncbi:auxin-responsive protein SAUR26-like [Andrographis paniculata]|uniref:auxin-responsive protein SAUR26-like n=1 Tax=Andrographis paniculata TaxID=175694 RepID=UPI0021E9438E|nr:auxin-responsive protein SAUR26-like [Andrographis paniculata]
MMGIKKLRSVRKLAKKVKVIGGAVNNPKPPQYECLPGGETNSGGRRGGGTFAVYVGKERERFVVPTAYLSHPLFKILLEKAREEFGFEHQEGLAVPCSVATFRQVIHAVETSNGGFCIGELVEGGELSPPPPNRLIRTMSLQG